MAAKATVTTICSSFGGGLAGIIGCYIFWKGKMKVPYIVNCVFASLASITGNANNIHISSVKGEKVNAMVTVYLVCLLDQAPIERLLDNLPIDLPVVNQIIPP